MPSCANLEIYQGDDFAASIDVLNADGTDADLDGYTALAQIRSNVADVATSVIADLVIQIQLPNTILLFLSHNVTRAMTMDYVWDLELTGPLGAVTTLMTGDVRVELEVDAPAGGGMSVLIGKLKPVQKLTGTLKPAQNFCVDLGGGLPIPGPTGPTGPEGATGAEGVTGPTGPPSPSSSVFFYKEGS